MRRPTRSAGRRLPVNAKPRLGVLALERPSVPGGTGEAEGYKRRGRIGYVRSDAKSSSALASLRADEEDAAATLSPRRLADEGGSSARPGAASAHETRLADQPGPVLRPLSNP